MRLALIPSNQPANDYMGLFDVNEEKWAVATCAWVQKRLKDYDCEVGYFHIPGAGTSSTDELARMVKQAVAWKPDYMVSIHSDSVGDKAKTGILALSPRLEDSLEVAKLARIIARRVGLPYRGTWVYGIESRKILFLREMRENSLRGCLVEVGEHSTASEAAWNWSHVKEIGVGIADALAEYLQLEPTEKEEDLTDEQDRLLRLSRVSGMARSYDMEIIKALIRGNEESASKWESEKSLAVEAERKKLGL